MTKQYDYERQIAEEAARTAGAIIRTSFGRSHTVGQKGQDNPVTEVDLRSNRCIHDIITTHFPGDGWLSEESVDSSERLRRSRVWIVDPLDGTKEFIQGVPEFAVCIALVEDGVPVVGVEYNPITGELFSCARGRGLTLNGRSARVSDCGTLEDARVLASRSEDARGEWEPFKPFVQVVLTGSVAYKLARIAAGLGDATFSLTPKHEWDICAGAALIVEGGGRITDSSGKPLVFNQLRPKLPGLIATNNRLYEPVRHLIARITARSKGVTSESS